MFCRNDPRHGLYHLKEIWSEKVEFEPSYGQKTENLEFQTFSRGFKRGHRKFLQLLHPVHAIIFDLI